MYLVWTAGRIFIKPVPRFLLEPDFWAVYLTVQMNVAALQAPSPFKQPLKRSAGAEFSVNAHSASYTHTLRCCPMRATFELPRISTSFL